MRTGAEAAVSGQSPDELAPNLGLGSDVLKRRIQEILDDAKAEAIVTIDLRGKSSLGDYMIVATGRTDRHVGAIGDQIQRKLKELGFGNVRIEGLEACDWVLIDAGDVIVHVFRPEVRQFYNIEKMWSGERPTDTAQH